MFARRLLAQLTLTTMVVLGGCSPYGWESRHGLEPVIDAASVETESVRKRRVLEALAADAQITVGPPEAWYLVAEAGFNYVDDQCRAYFNDLFFINRHKERIKGGLSAVGAATSGILGITGASATSLAIVGQAFGLGVNLTELVAGSYLYQIPPATTQSFVRELQIGFREGAAARRHLVNTPMAAYHLIQDYLSLCLPSTIEAKIIEHISSARAVPRRGRSGSIAVRVRSAPPSEVEPPVLVAPPGPRSSRGRTAGPSGAAIRTTPPPPVSTTTTTTTSPVDQPPEKRPAPKTDEVPPQRRGVEDNPLDTPMPSRPRP
jgi:hypothetical protein